MVKPSIMPEAHSSSWLLLTLTFVGLTLSQEQSQAPAGIRLSVPESEFDRFTTLSNDRRKHLLKKIQFANLTGHDNDLSWTLTNIHGSKLINIEAHDKFGDDGNVKIYGILRNCSLMMNWSMSEVLVVGKAQSIMQSQGILDVDVGSVSIKYTIQAVMKGGSLSLKMHRCSLEVSQLSVKSVDSNLNQFVELIASSFSPDLKKLLNDSVCKDLVESTVVVQHMFASSHLKQSFSKFGENVTIDASFLSMNISKGAFQALHKGDVCLNGKCLPVTDAEFPHEPPSDGIAVDIKKEVLDNAIILLKETKLLDMELTFQTIIEKKLTWLNMTCWNTLCIENFFPDIASRWPGRVVGVRMRVGNIRLSFANSAIVIYAEGRVYFSADNATDVTNMFSADCRLEVPLVMQFRNNTLSLKASGIGGSFVIDQSFVGQILNPQLQQYINETVVEQQILPKIHDQIEKHIISYHIPVAKDLAFDSAKIILFDDMIRLQANLCDPFGSTCGTAPSDEWVGNMQVPRLQIDDIVPTTPAPKSTTKNPTSSGQMATFSLALLIIWCFSILM
ncbi:uncharacterized protein LOC127858851 isoform X1 [Dreissena polymorpha]|nr:uncharacterized protein LOC127858851 isoform X1 [Dreissena polymorpha]XP_052252142.1 uncharacterized protein LOC127858851 isoform X1 [Dreissena polymorpha]XP_052252143.1 uncharacterized protein LOC127858851 isoform X1 [Dreissena polymorpha]